MTREDFFDFPLAAYREIFTIDLLGIKRNAQSVVLPDTVASTFIMWYHYCQDGNTIGRVQSITGAVSQVSLQ